MSPLILRQINHQGIDIPRSPRTDFIFGREQNIWRVIQSRSSFDHVKHP